MKDISHQPSAISLLIGSLCALGAPSFAAVCEGWGTPTAAHAEARALRLAANRVGPSVVTIETIGGAMPPEEKGRKRSFQVADGPTTGLVYASDGLIITSSFNFVRDPSVITITLADGRQLLAELLARDEIHKLAMLRVDADGLPVPQWCRESEVRVGMSAVALGRGFGGEQSALSVGIVSATGRFDGLAVQTDAKLSPGNYGGPLVALDGSVIGICVPLGPKPGELAGVELYDSGVGFAIPRGQIATVADRLARGESIRPGKIGVIIKAAEPEGVRVTAVAERSPGREAGMQKGDRIVEIDGRRIGDLADLKRVMAARAAGDVVAVAFVRGDDRLHVQVTLRPMSEIGSFPRASQPATAPSTAPSSQPSSQPASRPAM